MSHGAVGGAFQPVAPGSPVEAHGGAVAADRPRARAFSTTLGAARRQPVGGRRSDSLQRQSADAARCPRRRARGRPLGADDRQRGPPGPVEQCLGTVRDHRLRRCREGILADRRCRRESLPRAWPARRAPPESAHGIRAAARARSPASSMRSRSLRAMRNDEGTMPLASPECTPSVSTSTVKRAAGEPAQRRRRPQALVVAAAGIEPDDEVDAAHARRERLEIRGQVVSCRSPRRFRSCPRSASARRPAPAARRSRRAPRTPHKPSSALPRP